MSNCDLVAARSLMDWATSRLALRAPALRAATALTRPNPSAQRLSCGRHAVSTAVAIDPIDVVNCAIREYLRNPSLLMRARAQATVRVWKKRPELQAHSRIRIQSGCGLPVATRLSLCSFRVIQSGASSLRCLAARRRGLWRRDATSGLPGS